MFFSILLLSRLCNLPKCVTRLPRKSVTGSERGYCRLSQILLFRVFRRVDKKRRVTESGREKQIELSPHSNRKIRDLEKFKVVFFSVGVVTHLEDQPDRSS